MKIGIFIGNNERQKTLIEELEVFFRNNDIFNAILIPIQASQSEISNIRTPGSLEKVLSKYYVAKPGDLLVAEWKNLQDEVLVANERTLFVSPKSCKLIISFSKI